MRKVKVICLVIFIEIISFIYANNMSMAETTSTQLDFSYVKDYTYLFCDTRTSPAEIDKENKILAYFKIPLSQYLPALGKSYNLNKFYYKFDKIVYGRPSDVKGNNYDDEGDPRYYGFTAKGDVYSNNDFDCDAGGTWNPSSKHDWICRPWNNDNVCRPYSPPADVSYFVNGKYYNWLSNGYWVNNLNIKYTLPEFKLPGPIQDYVVIVQAPGDYFDGSGNMYRHSGSGYYYITITFPHTKPLPKSLPMSPPSPDFKILYNGKDVTGTEPDDGKYKPVEITGYPYTVSLVDASTGNVISRDWSFYDNSMLYEAKFSSAPGPVNFDIYRNTITSDGKQYFKLCVNGKNDLFKEHYVRAVVVTPTPMKNPVVTPTPALANGQIEFNPNQCDWRNTNLSVNVRVIADKTLTVSGTERRYFTYSESYLSCDQDHEHDAGCYSTRTVNSWVYQPFTQVWNIGNIIVSGKPLASSVEISDNSNVTVSNEGKGRLNAKLEGWVLKSNAWGGSNTPMGTWNTGSPTLRMPTQDYDSESLDYRIDKTKPLIKFDWSKKDSTARAPLPHETIYEYVYLPDNSVDFEIADAVSGVKSVEYWWTDVLNNKTEPGNSILGGTTSELTGEEKDLSVKVHEGHKRIGLWDLHVKIRDRAGNVTETSERLNIRCYLYDFRITDIKDPNWKPYFRRTDSSLIKEAALKVNKLPAVNRPVAFNKAGLINNTIPKKGYAFYFRFNSKGLNENADSVIITPSFYYVKDTKGSSKTPVDLYYKVNNQYIKFGSAQDKHQVDYNGLKIGTLTALNKLPRTFDLNVDPKTGEWGGDYYIPAETIALKQGSKFRYDDRLKDGYIVVNFKINAYKGGVLVFSYLTDITKGVDGVQWLKERDTEPPKYIFNPGDAILFNNRYSSLDDYRINTDR